VKRKKTRKKKKKRNSRFDDLSSIFDFFSKKKVPLHLARDFLFVQTQCFYFTYTINIPIIATHLPS